MYRIMYIPNSVWWGNTPPVTQPISLAKGGSLRRAPTELGADFVSFQLARI